MRVAAEVGKLERGPEGGRAGLGFARALLEIGLPEGEVPLALFAFNLGVEVGQLMFIALVLAVGALAARLAPVLAVAAARPGGRGIGTASYLMGGVAAVWFIGRLAALRSTVLAPEGPR